MGVFDFKEHLNDPSDMPSLMERVLNHWLEIVDERKTFEQFMANPAPKPIPSKAIESAFGSDYDVDFVPGDQMNLAGLNSCWLNGRSPTQVVKLFRPMLKHVELNRGHIVNGWYTANGDPVAIVSLKKENDAHLWIKALEVNEKFRGRGIGKQMMQWVIHTHNEPLYLAVHPDNKVAIFMYDNLGFELDPASQQEFKAGKRLNVVMIRR